MRRAPQKCVQQMFRADTFKATRGSNMALDFVKTRSRWTLDRYQLLGVLSTQRRLRFSIRSEELGPRSPCLDGRHSYRRRM
jgi:hypothetical protein